MRVLVTGGAGYVGSHVVRALLDAGHDPIVYDNLSTGHAQAVSDAELVVGDVGDRERLDELLGRLRFDGCVHLAAISLVGESMQNPARYFRSNVGAGQTLMDALVGADVPWVVLSSTAAVYGNPHELPITENHMQSPTSPYGESKRVLERVLHWYGSAYGFRSAALRYFNAAGAHPDGTIGEDHTPETHLIPLVIQVVQGQRDAIDVFGTDYPTPDGTPIRDYVHVCDLASAHVAVMDKLATGGHSSAYNLGTECGYSVFDVIEMVKKVTGKQVPMKVSPRRPGDPPVLIANPTKATAELNWVANFDLEAIVESAWRWHKTKPYGYR